MDKLLIDFKDSVFEDNIEIVNDYAEIGIDSFIEEGILKEIPVVNTIVSGLKIAKNIYDRNLLKQTLAFLNEFNSNKIDRRKIEKYKKSIEKDKKKLENELSRVLIILNMNLDKEKSIILAKLYKARINEDIKWEEFIEFTEITNRLFLADLELLKVMWKKDYNSYKKNPEDKFRVERIYSLGIIGNIFPTAIEVYHLHGKILNELGKKYCKIIFEQ